MIETEASAGQMEALKRIEEAERTGAFALRLDHLDLDVVPSEIGRLTGLCELYLAGNTIRQLPPEIGELTNLTWLDASRNQLTSLPAEIGSLTSLTRLRLGKNQIATLPPEIGQLQSLDWLDLSENQLSSLPPEMFRLSNLQWLGLSANRLSWLPAGVAGLKGLRWLSLSSNQLAALPAEIGALSDLTELHVSDNRLTSLPREVFQLTNIRLLAIMHNLFTSLSPEIGRLANLSELYATSNPLKALPPQLGQLQNLRHLRLDDHSGMSSPPPEVAAKGTNAILEYLLGLDRAAERMWKSRMLVLGAIGAGKTALLRSLSGADFAAQQEASHTLEIRELQLPHPRIDGVTMRIGAWDFSEREVRAGADKLFLSDHSLVMLVWNAADELQHSQLESRLTGIAAQSPKCSIVLVSTHSDQECADPPVAELMERYSRIVGYFAVSNSTGAGISALRAALSDILADMPLMGELWPVTWVRAAEAVQSLPDRHIPAREFLRRLEDHGLTGDDALTLSSYLHELGEILHFPDVDELSDTVILQPEWIAGHTALVIESESVRRSGGILSREEMDPLWYDIDPEMRMFLLRVLEQFGVAYRTGDSEELSIVADCVPEKERDFGPRWDLCRPVDGRRELSIKLELSAIPSSLPIQFIAHQHRFTTHLHWRDGVLFEDDAHAHLALVRVVRRECAIWLSARGQYPQHFFALLLDGLERNLQSYPGLQIVRKIPCACGEIGAPCLHEFEYERLLHRKTRTIECPISGKKVFVEAMLFGVSWDSKTVSATDSDDPQRQRRKDLDRIGDQTELIQREFVGKFTDVQSATDSECPNVFILRRRRRSSILESITGPKIELELLCQCPGSWHGTGKIGVYDVDNPVVWIEKMKPYLSQLAHTLRKAPPSVAADQHRERGGSAESGFAEEIAFMEKLAVEVSAKRKRKTDPEGVEPASTTAELQRRALLRSLCALRDHLQDGDPNHVWGGLTKVATPDGCYLWLCEQHAGRIWA